MESALIMPASKNRVWNPYSAATKPPRAVARAMENRHKASAKLHSLDSLFLSKCTAKREFLAGVAIPKPAPSTA